MYFNIWSNENYTLKWVFLWFVLFLIIFIVVKIFIQAYKKYKIVSIKKKKKISIINIIKSDEPEEKKFNDTKDILWLDSSYKIEDFTGVKHKEILDLIQEKKYSIINNIIYNNIINNNDKNKYK